MAIFLKHRAQKRQRYSRTFEWLMKVKGRSIKLSSISWITHKLAATIAIPPYCYRCHYPYHYTVYMTNRTSSPHCQGSRVLERSGHSDWPCEKQPTQRCTKAVRTTLVHVPVLYVLVAGRWIKNFPQKIRDIFGAFHRTPSQSHPSLRPFFTAVTRWAPQDS